MAGFDAHPVLATLGLHLASVADLEGCPKTGQIEPCPAPP
jgi:hypothetical protein